MGRVVCAGHVNWDVTLYVDALPEADGEAHLRSRLTGGGGSAANVASSLVDLGVDAAVIGSVGDDDLGRTVQRDLADRGVDVRWLRTVEGGTTTRKYLIVDDAGRVSVLGDDGVNDAIDPADVEPELLRETTHFHLTGQRPGTAEALAEMAVESGVTVSFDPGRQVGEKDFSALAGLVDLVFVNRAESRAVDGTFLDGDGALVVTYGEDGATVRSNGQRYDHPGFPARSVDTTGAGDAFAAGFITAWLDDADFERALSVGNAAGAIATEGRGAGVELDPERVEARARENA